MAERALELVAKAAPYLARHGSSSPRLDAELLLAEALHCERMDLYLRFDQPLSGPELDAFRALCRRRAGGEPVAYIRGRKEFMSLELRVAPSVLVPRPETEVLVEAALARLRGRRGVRVLDVGTGSGAIALALLAHHEEATAVATDVSPAALDVARGNAERLGLADRLDLRLADLAGGVEGPFDLVAANLPYIDPEWPDGVTPEVAGSEPPEALYGGAGGLELIARLLADLPRLRAAGGVALLEVDPRNATRAAELAAAVGQTSLLPDLAGHDRVLVVETP